MFKNYVDDYPAQPDLHEDYLDYEEMLESVRSEIKYLISEVESGNVDLIETILELKAVYIEEIDKEIDLELEFDSSIEEIVEELKSLKMNLNEKLDYEGMVYKLWMFLSWLFC